MGRWRSRRVVPAAVAVGIVAGLHGGSAGPAQARLDSGTVLPPRPNIIVVMTDDMRADDLVAMPKTRELIGTGGITFTNSIVTFALCCPSRATFLTGLYPHNHGVTDNHAPNGGFAALDDSETLPVWLQRSGYATVMMGKYLNDYGVLDPTYIPPGWTEWHGALALQYYGGRLNEDGLLVRLGLRVPEDYATDVYRERALDIVRRRAPSAQPFFLWLSFYAPHTGQPTEPDDPVGMPTPAVPEYARGRFDTLPPRRLPSFDAGGPVIHRAQLSSDQIAQIDEHYRQRLEALTAVDKAVSRLVNELRVLDELSNTVIVFTSDNGFFLGERRIPSGKLWFYEEALRVPLLMRGPGIQPGSKTNQLVANLDLAPTLLELGRAAAPAGWAFDGKSLGRFLADPTTTWSREYLIESPTTKTGLPSFWAIRTPRYLLAQYPNPAQGELYDLAADPFELRSVWSDPSFAQVRKSLGRMLETLKTCQGLACRP